MYRSLSVAKVSSVLDLDPELLEFPQPAPIPTDRPELPKPNQLPLYKIKNLNYERSQLKENELSQNTSGHAQTTERLSSILDEWNAMKETINTSRGENRRFMRNQNDENSQIRPSIPASRSYNALRPSNDSAQKIASKPLQTWNKPTKWKLSPEDGVKTKIHRRQIPDAGKIQLMLKKVTVPSHIVKSSQKLTRNSSSNILKKNWRIYDHKLNLDTDENKWLVSSVGKRLALNRQNRGTNNLSRENLRPQESHKGLLTVENK